MSDNLEIWNKLGKTDPKHTKGFKRAGGFGGTAIKPIYTEQKMTEVFGPAGKGWGMGEPLFQTVPGNDGQVAVFCTVGLWWADPGDEAKNYVHTVYGVGGDMVVVKQSSGLRTDDEAFKKAFTDAVGNAMKHLGMSADVHMGLFDDSKYVQEREREERAQEAPSEPVQPSSGPVSDTVAKKIFPTLQSDLRACTTTEQLDGAWGRWLPTVVNWSDSMQANCDDTLQEMKRYLAEHAGDGRKAARGMLEGDLRSALSMDDLKQRWEGMGDAMRKLGKEDNLALSRVKEEMKSTIGKLAKPANFDNLEPDLELTQAQKLAGTP